MNLIRGQKILLKSPLLNAFLVLWGLLGSIHCTFATDLVKALDLVTSTGNGISGVGTAPRKCKGQSKSCLSAHGGSVEEREKFNSRWTSWLTLKAMHLSLLEELKLVGQSAPFGVKAIESCKAGALLKGSICGGDADDSRKEKLKNTLLKTLFFKPGDSEAGPDGKRHLSYDERLALKGEDDQAWHGKDKKTRSKLKHIDEDSSKPMMAILRGIHQGFERNIGEGIKDPKERKKQWLLYLKHIDYERAQDIFTLGHEDNPKYFTELMALAHAGVALHPSLHLLVVDRHEELMYGDNGKGLYQRLFKAIAQSAFEAFEIEDKKKTLKPGKDGDLASATWTGIQTYIREDMVGDQCEEMISKIAEFCSSFQVDVDDEGNTNITFNDPNISNDPDAAAAGLKYFKRRRQEKQVVYLPTFKDGRFQRQDFKNGNDDKFLDGIYGKLVAEAKLCRKREVTYDGGKGKKSTQLTKAFDKSVKVKGAKGQPNKTMKPASSLANQANAVMTGKGSGTIMGIGGAVMNPSAMLSRAAAGASATGAAMNQAARSVGSPGAAGPAGGGGGQMASSGPVGGGGGRGGGFSAPGGGLRGGIPTGGNNGSPSSPTSSAPNIPGGTGSQGNLKPASFTKGVGSSQNTSTTRQRRKSFSSAPRDKGRSPAGGLQEPRNKGVRARSKSVSSAPTRAKSAPTQKAKGSTREQLSLGQGLGRQGSSSSSSKPLKQNQNWVGPNGGVFGVAGGSISVDDGPGKKVVAKGKDKEGATEEKDSKMMIPSLDGAVTTLTLRGGSDAQQVVKGCEAKLSCVVGTVSETLNGDHLVPGQLYEAFGQTFFVHNGLIYAPNPSDPGKPHYLGTIAEFVAELAATLIAEVEKEDELHKRQGALVKGVLGGTLAVPEGAQVESEEGLMNDGGDTVPDRETYENLLDALDVGINK